ncbi:hypothetical protein ACFVQB_14665 [Paenibacillus sp. NPDC057886]|uniref:hypothetical protein n=1 Tax=Paenibacillus sp. NPDC057886 TaxID=3346270 RepID=UPI0036BE56C0
MNQAGIYSLDALKEISKVLKTKGVSLSGDEKLLISEIIGKQIEQAQKDAQIFTINSQINRLIDLKERM